ncbi:hypothetical protein BDZ45DRAFT_805322 [Acephala macrosclerotiorum]|nr:hypothetical protein BDZ45DRAFT_805322 [Acephala macrosclerotiorum]
MYSAEDDNLTLSPDEAPAARILEPETGISKKIIAQSVPVQHAEENGSEGIPEVGAGQGETPAISNSTFCPGQIANNVQRDALHPIADQKPAAIGKQKLKIAEAEQQETSTAIEQEWLEKQNEATAARLRVAERIRKQRQHEERVYAIVSAFVPLVIIGVYSFGCTPSFLAIRSRLT